MTFRIDVDVKRLDEIKRKLDELREGLTLHGLQHWAKEIEVAARGLAAARSSEEVKESIHIEVAEVEPKKFEVKASTKEEALSLIAEATQNKLPEMPVTSRSIFKAFLDQVEKKLGRTS